MTAVVQFNNTLSALDGGPARHALEVNFALNAIGVPTRLITIHGSEHSLLEHYVSRVDYPALDPRTLTLRGRRARAHTYRAIRDAFQARSWIIHGYFLGWVPLVAVLGLLSGKQILIMPHGALTKYDRQRHRLKKLAFGVVVGWWLNRSVDFVVATGQEAQELSALARTDRLFVVGAGAGEPPEAPASRGPHLPLRLLSVSRIAPKKRIDLSIRALAELLARGVEAQLSIAGVGTDAATDELRMLSKSLQAEHAVRFVGQVEGARKEALFRDNDVFLLLSEDENFGIGVAEALARGLPVITTDAVASVVSMPASAGRRLTDVAPEHVADEILDVVQDYVAARTSAVEYASQQFSWRSVAARWARVMSVDASGSAA
ncbi:MULTISPECIES: glycosyltransferase [unclassified Microbacterium]|uniref:glycosyltransferase n=1 Tax=unclassified Microbacterium TaxID=2609290 RepID=UPI00214CD02C|nr:MULTISPECIES: glycosyltransferase [unclassified Microbacterium]MCR2808900.1 glycosyltransferase [Microbacterium sp. zg.B185]WIM18681.1 glycosyltransferase [Microbacterium sp. zg-B185]